MFEANTYEKLLDDVLNNAPKGIDTRKGSIFYDAVSGILLKVAKLYTDLDLVLEMTTLSTATGDALDARASEYGMFRRAATPAQYRAIFDGVTPQNGERFYYDGAYFLVRTVEDKGETVYVFEAEIPGESGNNIYEGTPAVPAYNIDGLISATFGYIYENGSDDEDDESLRTRVQEKIAGPAENGNKQHYKTWCESFDGIGRARIFPLWNGPNTVKAVLIDGEGKPCSEAKVAEVQEYIDPATKGYTAVVSGKTFTVGDGVGDGVANIGAHFTATAAAPVIVDVSFKAEFARGALVDAVKQEATDAISAYLKGLVLGEDGESDVVVKKNSIGAILSGLHTILDYDELKLNGEEENITTGGDDVPVLGEVLIYEIL